MTKAQKLPYELTVKLRATARSGLHQAIAELHEVIDEPGDSDTRRDKWFGTDNWTAYTVYTNKNAQETT